MGLIDFIKDAGAKVFGRDHEPEASPEQQNAEIQAAFKAKREQALMSVVSDLGLSIENLKVDLMGDTVVVHGTAKNQADREKAALALGNVAGIRRVDDRIEVVTPEPEAQMYTVVPGDSLSKIAKKFYGNANKYMVIFEANKPMLKDPDKIYPGQVLRIPPQS